MKKFIFIITIVTLSSLLLVSMASPYNEKRETAKKFKEVKRLIVKTKKTHQIPFEEIMPRIKEAEKFFKQGEYEQTRKILDEVIAKLKALKKSTPLKDLASRQMDVAKINTSGWQDTPFISSDGKKLYFTYSPIDFVRAQKTKFKEIKIRGPIRPGRKKEEFKKRYGMVAHNFVATRNADGTWSAPESLHFDGGDFVGGSMWVSRDGNTMYLAGWPTTGRINYGHGDIYIATIKTGNNWTKPVNLGPAINTKYLEDNPHFVESRQILYFDSERPGGFGHWDIYYAYKEGDNWSEPVNIGPSINTEEVEGMAFLSEDGKKLYFMRGGKKTGLPRLFVTELRGSRWLKPKLVNLGKNSLNSPSLTKDGNKLYFLHVNHQTKELTIWFSKRKKDGTWGNPKPVD